MTHYFVADMHLDDKTPELFQAFYAFLDHITADAEAIFLMGDIFERWIGDDDNAPAYVQLIHRLKKISDQGIKLYVMHGNRDFLIGSRFEQQTGSQLLEDPYPLQLNQQKILLTHGDLLCTDDKEYQRVRKVFRNPVFKWFTQRLTLQYRKHLADKARARSQRLQQNLASNITDVNQDTIDQWFNRYHMDILLHGHTHRPERHPINTDSGARERLVLGSWSKAGGVYAHDKNGKLELENFVFNRP